MNKKTLETSTNSLFEKKKVEWLLNLMKKSRVNFSFSFFFNFFLFQFLFLSPTFFLFLSHFFFLLFPHPHDIQCLFHVSLPLLFFISLSLSSLCFFLFSFQFFQCISVKRLQLNSPAFSPVVDLVCFSALLFLPIF